MAQQTFAVDREPRVVMTQLRGDLIVRAWQQPLIQIDTDGSVADLHQEGNALMIVDCASDITLHVPANTGISATTVAGDVAIEGVRLVQLEHVSSDVTLRGIGGDVELASVAQAIELANIGGDLEVTGAPQLRVRHNIGGEARIKDVAVVEIETVSGDLALVGGETVIASTVGGDLHASDVTATLRCGVVGGDCALQGSARTQVVVGNVGGDCTLSGALSVHAGNIGGDCHLRDVQSEVEVGHVSGSGSFQGVGGSLQAGHIGGDGDLQGIQGSVEIGSVGGDLALQSLFPVDTRSRLIVGGDAHIVIPVAADLHIRATVGGEISGRSVITSRSGNMVSLIYGEGRAHLDLNVGGDLGLQGESNPRSSSSASGSWSDFGREMSQLGRDLGKLGQELGREIAAAFNETSWTYGSGVADEMAYKAEAKARDAQRKAEEQVRRANERAARMNIRFNDREWRLDPQRLERIREQARRAADEGVAGALDAVERAMSNLRVPTPPAPPSPPAPAQAPHTPAAGSAPPQDAAPGPEQQAPPLQGQRQVLDPEQEREAILRMIAEGRVTPEEGDLLLEALGS